MRPPGAGLAGRHVIMLLLALLVALFLGGMWLLSSLNLRIAESSLAELRERQILETFQANRGRIDDHHRRMEQNTRDLARTGELLVALDGGREAVEAALRQALVDFPDAQGVTLWLTDPSLTLGVHAWREGETLRVEPLEAGWSEADWLRRRLDAWREGAPAIHWTAAYFKSRIDDVVVSVGVPMIDAEGRLLGMAASDWVAGDIIGLVSDVDVTPSAFAFLVDRENRNLSSLAWAEDQARAQPLIEAIIDLELHRDGTDAQARRSLALEGEAWTLLHANTRAGMVFGIGVPQAEIDAVLVPMRQANLRIMSAVGAGVLLLAVVILLRVAGMLRRLRTLYTDPLTGLPNRARLLADLEEQRPGALVLVNVDGFKQFNGVFGHECGDQVIRHMVARLEALLALPEWRGSRLYRMPADEQAIWLPGRLPPEALPERLQALQSAVGSTRLIWRGQELPLHATLGLAASWQLGEGGREGLLSAAGMALRQAREQQLGYRIHDPASRMREGYEQNLAWANRLTAALEEGRIVAYFQPILDLASGRVAKHECLMRLIDEAGEPVGPGQFLEVARRSRLHRRLTLTMVERCLEAMRDSDGAFSLNLSVEDLLDPEISEPLLARVAESGLGELLILELLESEGIEDYAAVGAVIARARALGVGIAIDDFGTGYANFEHLLRLDVDLLKIDGSLIRHLDRDPGALTLTRGIVRFARELGLQTVAEFVHSPEVLALVRELGIDHAQGACIGMPAPRPLRTSPLA
ncbi:EAL domain-containing protein [Halomonas sp. 3H]|uniref:EAL domain-containing protein n=1 Tax=Halomonas sp. 3H TaxID=2952527 RepID=UPI0020B652FC|nr:EAL domain-containing protein [Halomonas sp. 3H]